MVISGVKIVGVLGILIASKQKNLIGSVKKEVERLRSKGFRLNQGLVESVLRRLGEV